MSALDAFRAAFGDWSPSEGVGARSQHPSGVLATDGSVVGQPRFRYPRFECLDCGLELEYDEIIPDRQPHGEIILLCVCGSSEIEDQQCPK